MASVLAVSMVTNACKNAFPGVALLFSFRQARFFPAASLPFFFPRSSPRCKSCLRRDRSLPTSFHFSMTMFIALMSLSQTSLKIRSPSGFLAGGKLYSYIQCYMIFFSLSVTSTPGEISDENVWNEMGKCDGFSSSFAACVKTITLISVYVFPPSLNPERKLKIGIRAVGLSVVSNTCIRITFDLTL